MNMKLDSEEGGGGAGAGHQPDRPPGTAASDRLRPLPRTPLKRLRDLLHYLQN